jgi:hypothetical protein
MLPGIMQAAARTLTCSRQVYLEGVKIARILIVMTLAR